MVEDDFPALGSFLHNKGEDAFGVAAGLLVAFEVVFADDDGESFVQRVDLEVGEGKRAHGGPIRVVALVALDEAAEAAADIAREEQDVGRVFVGFDEGGEVALVPGSFLREQSFDAAELDRAGGVELWILAGDGECRAHRGKQEKKSESTERGLHGWTWW